MGERVDPMFAARSITADGKGASAEDACDDLLRLALETLSEEDLAALEADIERFERTGLSSPRIIRVFAALQELSFPSRD